MAYDILRRKIVNQDWTCGASEVGTLDPNDFFMSPGEVRDEVRTLDGFAHSLDKDIRENLSKLPRSYVDEWVRFYREWSEFKKSAGYFSSHQRSTRNKAIEYGARIKEWQKSFFEMTHVNPSAGKIPEAPSPKYAMPDFEQLKPWLIGAGVLVGVGYGMKLLTDTGALSAIRSRVAPSS